MKAVTLESPRTFRTIDIAEPAPPGPGEALVRTHCMGVCGTDVSAYLGKFPFFDYPRIPGHELGVEVLEVGAGVTHITAGDSCSVEPYLNCGTCYACRHGNTNCCTTLSVIGIMQNGGLCERFTIRADKLHRSKSLNFDQLALVETLAIGRHAAQRAAPEKETRAVIIGLGPIGLATLEFMLLAGAKVTVVDRDASRLAFCQSNYAIENAVLAEDAEQLKARLREITGGDGFPTVIDATGNPHSMMGAMHHAAPTGTVVFAGITTTELSFSQPVMHRPELTLKATRNALPDDFRAIIDLIEAGSIDTNPWITHRTNCDRLAADFPTFLDPQNGVVKAVIDL